MMIQRCGGNQDWLGGRDEAEIESAVRDKRLLSLELEWVGPGRRRMLSMGEREAVVDQALALGARRFILQDGGGAPADHDAMALLRRIRSRGGEVVVITGGRSISRAMALELAGLGVHVIWRWPAGRPAALGKDAATVGLSRNLAHLFSAGYPAPGLRLGIRIPVERSGLRKVEKIWRWSLSLGLTPSLERAWRGDAGAARRGPSVSPAELRTLAGRLAAIEARESGSDWSSRAFPALFGCDRFRTSLAVTADGDVRPCLGLGLKLGNVRETDLGRIVRNDPVLSEMRNPRTKVNGFCQTCGYAATCSGCRAVARLWTDDLWASDPECWEKNVPAGDVHAVDVIKGIPHKGPMRFLRGTAWLDDKKVTLAMRLPRRGVFSARDGTVIPLVQVEMLAQLCAAQRAHEVGTTDGSRVYGYLVGMDHVWFRKPVAAGDPLRLIVWNTLKLNEITRVEGEVFRGAELVARAELTLIKAETWFPPEEAAADDASPAADPRIPFPGGVSDRMGRGILRAMRHFEIEADGALRAVLRFDPDFVGFDGHFPGHPVVPGVGLVYAGLLLAEIGLGRNLVFRSLRRARFLKPVRPSVPLDVQVRISRRDGDSGIAAAVNILLGGKAAAKFEFGADEAGGGGR